MDFLTQSTGARWTMVTLAALALACGPSQRVTGVVEGVDPEYQQILIDQPGIEDRLPAGSVSLGASPELLETLQPGQIVNLEVGPGEAGPAIRSARFLRWANEEDGWLLSGGRRVRAERAAPFGELSDTEGRPVLLEDLRGRIVLIDFIYTTCHGPCPAQTHNMRRVQKRLSAEARPRVQILSVTIDPENDDADALAAYAARHQVDLDGWSFLTGSLETVEETRLAYHIGVTDAQDGGLDHSLRSYVIDDRGYLVDRYRSESFDPSEVIERLEALVVEARDRASSS